MKTVGMGFAKAFFIALWASIVASCAYAPITVSGDLQTNGLKDGGAIAGSIVYAAGDQYESYSSYRIWISKVGGLRNGVFVTAFQQSASDHPEIDDGKVRGNTFYTLLKPGEYEISDVTFFKNDGSGGRGFNASKPISVRFSVRNGETIYLGRFIAYGSKGKGLLGLPMPAGGYFEVDDCHEVDLKLLAAKTSGHAISMQVIAPDISVRDYLRPAAK